MDVIKWSVSLSISYLILKKLFPSTVKCIQSNVLFKSFKLYSNCRQYIKNIITINTKKLNFIKNGNLNLELKINNLEDIVDLSERIKRDISYDMIFYIDNNNYIRYDCLDDLIKNNLQYNDDLINFINIKIEYDDNTFTINLKNNNNYYIENNILFDKKFMKYYFNKYLNIDFDDKISYKIQILDNKFEELKLTNENYLIIGKQNSIKTIEKKIDEDSIDMCTDTVPSTQITQKLSWFSYFTTK